MLRGMTKTPKRPSARKKAPTKRIQWTAGVVRLPSPVVQQDGKMGALDALVWLCEGFVLGHFADKPDAVHASALESFHKTVAQPIIGTPHKPDVIRVADAALALALSGSGVEVVIGPTPEVHALEAEMHAHFEAQQAPDSYLSDAIDAAAVASFFRASAELYRAKPWKVIQYDRDVLRLTIEALDVRDAVLSVVGHFGESVGVVMFQNWEDFDAFVLHARDASDDEELKDELDEVDPNDALVPAIFAINYERGAELAPELRKEIAAHHWEVADAKAFPWLTLTDAGMTNRPCTPRDLILAEAIARALSKFFPVKETSKFLREKKAMRKALEEGERMVRAYSVATHQGELQVELAFPFSEPQVHTGLLAAMEAIEGTHDEDAYGHLCDALLTEFDCAPELPAFCQACPSAHVLEYAASYFETSIASLLVPELVEIVFEIIPRKVATDPSEAPAIIAELRAFYAFLKRVYALEQADACLRALSGDAVEKLAAALGDASKFGIAKSIFALGANSGFDMSSEPGVRTWMQELQKTGLPPSFELPSAANTSSSRRAEPKKAKQRKDARKAPKKNR